MSPPALPPQARVDARVERLSRHRPVGVSRWAQWIRRPVRSLEWLDSHNEGEPLVNVVMLMALLGTVMCAIGLSVFDWLGWGSGWAVAWVGLVVGVCARSVGLAARWAPVSVEQLDHVRAWTAQSQALSAAVSCWIRPSTPLCQSDYLAIRNAAAFESRVLRGQSLGLPSTTTPRWFDALGHGLRRLVRPKVPGLLPAPASVIWEASVLDNQEWVRKQRQGSIPSPVWPTGLTRQESSALVELETQWRRRKAAPSLPVTAEMVSAWGRWVYRGVPGAHRPVEGGGVVRAWVSAPLRLAVKVFFAVGLGFLLIEKLSWAWGLVSTGESAPTSWLGGAGMDRLVALEPYGWIIATGVALAVGGVAALATVGMLGLKKSWWSLPLSPDARPHLSALVSLFPAIKGPLLAYVGTDLCQADLDFARRAAKVLARYQHDLSARQDAEQRQQAMEGLPVMAQYRARQLDAVLAPATEPVQSKPRSRF